MSQMIFRKAGNFYSKSDSSPGTTKLCISVSLVFKSKLSTLRTLVNWCHPHRDKCDLITSSGFVMKTWDRNIPDPSPLEAEKVLSSYRQKTINKETHLVKEYSNTLEIYLYICIYMYFNFFNIEVLFRKCIIEICMYNLIVTSQSISKIQLYYQTTI